MRLPLQLTALTLQACLVNLETVLFISCNEDGVYCPAVRCLCLFENDFPWGAEKCVLK